MTTVTITISGNECLSLNHRNSFLSTNMAEAKQTYTEVSECDVTVQWVYSRFARIA